MKEKPATTIERQLDILKNRGCILENHEKCERELQRINYYRLSAYLLQFRKGDRTDNFKEGTSFLKVCRIYDFDQRMRRICNHALEQIEIFLRTQLSYFIAHVYGPYRYEDATNFTKTDFHEEFISDLEKEKERNRGFPFVQHYNQAYGGILRCH